MSLSRRRISFCLDCRASHLTSTVEPVHTYKPIGCPLSHHVEVGRACAVNRCPSTAPASCFEGTHKVNFKGSPPRARGSLVNFFAADENDESVRGRGGDGDIILDARRQVMKQKGGKIELGADPLGVRPTTRFKVSGTLFEIDAKYELIKPVGHGAYGVVISALNKETGQQVAIKKVSGAFEDLVDAKRILREITLLRKFDHDSIISIVDILVPPSSEEFEDVYIVSDLMETDLHRIINSKQDLSLDHVQYFLYQVLRALKYMHSSNVLHRDLKPSNLLLNSNCDLKVCDLGLARDIESGSTDLTEYVVTRWYRAPEIMLACQEYSKAIDMWSVGCIFAELMLRRPFFPGDNYIDQLTIICDKLGKPKEDDLTFVSTEKARRFIMKLSGTAPQPLRDQFPPTATEEALDLLSKMLEFNPDKRISVEAALSHSFMQSLHVAKDKPVTNFEFCFSFEAEEPSKHRLQELMWEEMRRYHPEQGPWKGIRPTNGTGAEKEAGSGAGTWGAVGAGAGDGGEARGASGARASRPLGSPRMIFPPPAFDFGPSPRAITRRRTSVAPFGRSSITARSNKRPAVAGASTRENRRRKCVPVRSGRQESPQSEAAAVARGEPEERPATSDTTVVEPNESSRCAHHPPAVPTGISSVALAAASAYGIRRARLVEEIVEQATEGTRLRSRQADTAGAAKGVRPTTPGAATPIAMNTRNDRKPATMRPMAVMSTAAGAEDAASISRPSVASSLCSRSPTPSCFFGAMRPCGSSLQQPAITTATSSSGTTSARTRATSIARVIKGRTTAVARVTAMPTMRAGAATVSPSQGTVTARVTKRQREAPAIIEGCEQNKVVAKGEANGMAPMGGKGTDRLWRDTAAFRENSSTPSTKFDSVKIDGECAPVDDAEPKRDRGTIRGGTGDPFE